MADKVRTDEERKKDLQWAKDRALEYLKINDPNGAIDSMASDLAKLGLYDEMTLAVVTLGAKMGAITADSAKRYIEGWN